MHKVLRGLVCLMTTTTAAPSLAGSPVPIPVIAAPDTPVRCHSTGETGSCPHAPTPSSSSTAMQLNDPCIRWESFGALAEYVDLADRARNRDAGGKPILPAFHEAADLLLQQRWVDTLHGLKDLDYPFESRPGRGEEPFPEIIEQVIIALTTCRLVLGPDESQHAPLPD